MLGVLTTVAPSKLHHRLVFSHISKSEEKKKSGSFITYQPWSDSAMHGSVNFNLIIPPRLGGKLAEVGGKT